MTQMDCFVNNYNWYFKQWQNFGIKSIAKQLARFLENIDFWQYLVSLAPTGHIPLNSLHTIQAVDAYCSYYCSCITFLFLHHNHKTSVSHHKNVLVSSRQSVVRWVIYKIALW